MSLLERFTGPGPGYSPLPIWWWSGARVTRDRVRRQMEQLVSQGVRQAVVMCLAPTGPMFGSVADDPPFLSPEWIGLLDGACSDAAELGFQLWMYDQIGFSGANFQGRLTAANPQYAGLALYRDAGGISQRVSGFDYFGADACAALLDQVHGTLDKHVGRWFGTVIPGFFQDELPPMPTWGRDFAETFAEHYGYEIVLPALFEGADEMSARIRRDYHEHRARLARRAFFDPLAAWFAERGLICGFDQASPAREGDPVGGVQLYGDYLGTHSTFGAPGSDHWGDPKVHSSLAHAHGKPRTWVEAFHSSGWGGTLEETYDWLAPLLRRGATLYDPHAVYYATVGGWWEWAPPSTCWRQPYWPSYHQFATAVTRLCSVLSGGTHVCDTVLLSPTSTVQAYTTLDGPLPPAQRAADCFHRLNGVSAWFAEQPGVLERAGIDHDTLDETTIAGGVVVDHGLKIGDEVYRTVILPNAEVLHPDAAQRLSEFARAGGTVVCVGTAPLPNATIVDSPDEVPDVLPAALVRADAPFLLRRYDDTFVMMVTAHDEHSGTMAPIVSLDLDDWTTKGFPWEEYWRQLRENGYRFVPPTGRVARIDAGHLPRHAQRWNPRTGQRTRLAVSAEGMVEVPFDDGSIALVIFGDNLPEPTAQPPGEVMDRIPVHGPWRALAESTLDNRDGDFAASTRTGVLPIEVWRFEDGTIAGYGPFAEARDPGGQWHPVEWSLSRGIRNDPVHNNTLGPKGYVPEEFLDWRHVRTGERVAVRTHLALPDRRGLHLAVGAGAARRVVVDGRELPIHGDGYQSFSPLPHGRTVAVEIEFIAEQDGPLRASFAVVADPAAYRRPEWLTGNEITHTFRLDTIPGDTTAMVASECACSVVVNGVEVGRQGDFNPYPGHREIRVHPYDLADFLMVGENTIALRLTGDAAATVDSPGLGLISGPGWEGAKVRRSQPRDPRFLCASARPHPLPGAHWLEPAAAGGDTVIPIIPDMRPGPERVEQLRFLAPLGTTALRIPTDLAVTVRIGESEYHPVDQRVRLPEPLPAGTFVTLEVHAVDGRRGGALLDSAIEVDVTEVDTPLAGWEELGLRVLGGHVRYRTTFPAPSGRVVLDLGEVRGTADVLVNGTLVDQLVWAPWRTEITHALRPGTNELEVVIRGTLAGYLDDASPTTAVAAGQVRTGLFGPVTLVQHKETP
ncbi:hypothetical protein KIPE111705_13060 [Kibdelosporangium persicum]|uniref:Glycoside hydrolase family 2 sugar binding protein n=1 Tax=Kibdelosporangium persicum TaxID=2698649 RepID=A0ABX2F895_9PSEU|nr:hypothetical protein [Kibdelosporangium persicum]NRN67141.1 Glycoside hydrolase family 2 sugar binding protein [Kibdelosporangium persicum]